MSPNNKDASNNVLTETPLYPRTLEQGTESKLQTLSCPEQQKAVLYLEQ